MTSTAEPPGAAAGAPSGRRRALFILLLAAITWLLCELLAVIAFRLATGERFSYRQLAAARADAGRTPPVTFDAGAEPAPEWMMTEEVLHPYLGYVFDEDRNRSEQRFEHGLLMVTPHGFLRPHGPPPEVLDDDFRIGIVGGSAAFLFSIRGQQRLITALAGLDAAAGRRIVVESLALGGYKQPQQLFTVAYMLALGKRFDVIVNLDGFNEVTFGGQNGQAGVYPAFPRFWPLRIQALPPAEKLRQLGLLALLGDRRQALARLAGRRWLRWSPLAGTLWYLNDRRLAARRLALDSALTEDRQGHGFRERGPGFDPRRDGDLYALVAEQWARSSIVLQRLCRAHGTRYLHLLQPNQYVEGSKPLSAEERRSAWGENWYREAVLEGYPHLRAAGAAILAQGVAYRDLTDLFAGASETLYSDACCHWNRRGDVAYLVPRVAAEIRALYASPAAE